MKFPFYLLGSKAFYWYLDLPIDIVTDYTKLVISFKTNSSTHLPKDQKSRRVMQPKQATPTNIIPEANQATVQKCIWRDE